MRSVDLTEDQSAWAKFGYAKVKLILCGPLRSSAVLCVKELTQRRDRRGPQRAAENQFAWGLARWPNVDVWWERREIR